MRFRFGRFRHDQETAGVFIDAMHQTDSGIIGIVIGVITKMPRNGVD